MEKEISPSDFLRSFATYLGYSFGLNHKGAFHKEYYPLMRIYALEKGRNPWTLP